VDTVTKHKTKSRSRPDTQERTRELGAPIVVSVRLPQELRDAIDAVRGATSRTQWIVEAARERLERKDGER
jgi:hypothetical protein